MNIDKTKDNIYLLSLLRVRKAQQCLITKPGVLITVYLHTWPGTHRCKRIHIVKESQQLTGRLGTGVTPSRPGTQHGDTLI